jgi:DNA-binding NarL/FixJ family response regulator
MQSLSHSTVLTIGIAASLRSTSTLDLCTAASVREALATMRLMSFDLVLAGLDDPSLDTWTVMQRVAAAWPQQRWILAAHDVSPEEEILARSLGALMVLGAVPDEQWLAECAASLKERRAAQRARSLPLVSAPHDLARVAFAQARTA